MNAAVKYLLTFFVSSTCLAEAPHDEISKLAAGNFEVCDIQVLSDGGTKSICLQLESGKLWLTKRSDVRTHWSAVYEPNTGTSELISISDSDADLALSNWLMERYSCEAVLNMKAEKFEASSREELIAATIVELIPTPSVCNNP